MTENCDINEPKNRTKYGYDTASNVTAVTYLNPNGVKYGFNYDQLNRLTQIATQHTGYLYTLDNAGNRKSGTELSGRTSNWTYDGIYRLTNETISLDPNNKNGTATYGLDPVGNRLTETSTVSGINSASFSFDQDDQLIGVGHDGNGNTTQAGANSYSYDTENHLVSMNGGAVTIVYDGDGNRVEKIVGGVATQYLVDDLNPTGYPQVVEELTAGAVTRSYTYGLQRISQNQVISNTWTPSFYGYDGFGTVRQLTNSSGAITDTYDYDAFGNEIHSAGSTPNNYLYRGEQYDSDLGLYYLRARYYNPLTGRFMSRDPEDGDETDPKTLHKYLYASADPVDFFDPTGRADTAEEEEEEGITLTTLLGRNPAQAAKLAALGIAGGSGVFATAAAINCAFRMDDSALEAVAQNLGTVQKILFYLTGCGVISEGPSPISSPGSGSAGGPGNSPPSPGSPPCSCQPGWHMHHMLPQQFRAWFGENPRDLNIDDPQFLVCMPPGAHIGKGGLHPSGWNSAWQDFISTDSNASAQDVLDQLQRMENEWRFQKPLNSCEN